RMLIAGVIVFLVLLLGFHIILNYQPMPALGWVYLALQLNLLLLLVPIIWYKKSYGWLHPLVFNIFLALIFHARRIGMYLVGIQWHPALSGLSDNSLTFLVAYELLLNAVGLIFYYLGFFCSPKFAIPKINFRQPPSLEKKVLIAILFSVMVFAVYMQTRGGIIAHILSWGRGRNAEFAGQYYWQSLIQFGLIACLIWLAMGRNIYTKPIFWISTAAMLLIQFLTTGGRGGVIYALIYMLLVFMIREQKIAPTKILIALMVGFILMGVLGELRQSTWEGDIGVGSSKEETSIGASFQKGLTEISERSWRSFGSLPILARVPNDVDFLYGSSYVALLSLPIPRGFWPEKPKLVGGRVTRTFFNGSYGIPPGAIGENYWNFGIPGVLGAFFIFGSFHKWLADIFRRYAQQPAAGILYALILYNAAPTSSAILACLLLIMPALMILRVMGAIV
ncbi:MAG: O-antigen polymerase, partial [Xenococcus sp. (in: cyanobacteria)]